MLICLVTSAVFAYGNHGRSSVLDNTSIRRSEKETNRQTSSFQNHRRYSAIVNSPKAKALHKEQAKQGKGL